MAYGPASFAAAVLQQLGIRPNRRNVSALVGWERAEGGHWHNTARYNPLNTTLNMPGSGDTGSQGNISVYRGWGQGIRATAKTLSLPAYGGIRKALASGTRRDVARAIDQSPWGTHGSLIYQTILGTNVQGVPSVHAPHATPAGAPGGGALGGLNVPPADLSVLAQALQPQQQQPVQATPLAPPSFSAAKYLSGNGLALPATQAPQQPDTGALASQLASIASAPGNVSLGGPQGTRQQGSVAGAPAGNVRVQGGKTITTTYGGVTERVKAAPLPKVSNPGQATRLRGVVNFEGAPVAAWIAPALAYARSHGWSGRVTEGFRTERQQAGIYNSGVRPAAKPGTSNHEFDAFPGGAVDVSNAAQLASILRRSQWGRLLVWAGSKDPVHFSHPHGGSY